MAEFIIAVGFKFNCYKRFRILNTITGTIEDIESIDLYRQMSCCKNKRNIENIRVKGESFEWIQGSWDRTCLVGDNWQPISNADALVIVGIDGEYVNVANWKGQIIKAHMLQVANNIKKRKFTLSNGKVESNGRITITYR